MIDFFVKSGTWAISITTLVFTFVPEKYFEKNIILNRILQLKGIITKLKLSMAIFSKWIIVKKLSILMSVTQLV